MAQRVRIPYRRQRPSSVTQLPILTALHAGFPTLFAFTIHDLQAIVNRFFENCGNFYHNGEFYEIFFDGNRILCYNGKLKK